MVALFRRIFKMALCMPMIFAGMANASAAVEAAEDPNGGPKGPLEKPETVPALAEVLLDDYGELNNTTAVEFVIDLDLMQPVLNGEKTVFAEDAPVKQADIDKAVCRIKRLTIYGDAKVPEPLFRECKTRGELAKTLYTVLQGGAVPNLNVCYKKQIQIKNANCAIENAYVFFSGGNAVDYMGTSNLVVRNSIIRGSTTKETKPLSGPPSGLTISGSIRTTLAMHQSQGFFINSKVITKDWAAYATDGAVPMGQPGQKELAIYTYGSAGIAQDGGYGTYSDLFCNTYFYGSELISAEIGAISGTFGKITLDTIAAGEEDPALSAYLTEDDCAAQPDKMRGSHIVAGRHAIMVHCVSLPPYWKYPGYSKSELPYHEGVVVVRHSTLETDMSLDKHQSYPEQVPAYINHVAGSVILVRSCNARILLEDVTVKPDPAGTGAFLHTAINSDLPFMVRVADGTVYPGSHVEVKDSIIRGNILHEDYQRDLYLSLKNSRLEGSLFTGSVDSWNAFCDHNGADHYIINPEGYRTVHGTHVTIEAGSTWVVTGESNLNGLTIHPGGRMEAPQGAELHIAVDGKPVYRLCGTISGDIRITL